MIANRFGLLISLSILYIALAEKVGISLQGVSSPQHFLCRCDDSPAGPIFVDPFHAGRTMTQLECVSWLKELTGLSVARIKPTLRVASARRSSSGCSTIFGTCSSAGRIEARAADGAAPLVLLNPLLLHRLSGPSLTRR